MDSSQKARLLEPFFQKLRVRNELSDDELNAIISASDDVRTMHAKTDYIREGDTPRYSTLILEGIAARSTTVEDGGRQITSFHIAGDFVDLQSFLLARMDHGIIAMTDLKVMTFPHDRLREISVKYPHLTRLLWLTTLLDGAIHRQ